jgi:hypothetical protein
MLAQPILAQPFPYLPLFLQDTGSAHTDDLYEAAKQRLAAVLAEFDARGFEPVRVAKLMQRPLAVVSLVCWGQARPSACMSYQKP